MYIEMGGCGSTSAIKIPHEKRYRRAIKLYQVTEVKSLTNLLNRNKCFESGESPLTLAAQEGHEAVVQSLISSGADVNKLDNNGRGPLHIAVQLNDEETADILLAANANPNKYDSSNSTPLHLAAENGHTGLVRRLLKAGANVNECERGVPPLALAVTHGHGQCAELLLERGADPNVVDGRGDTLLHVAVRQKDAVCTRLLLEYKADVGLVGQDDTPLVCLACLTGCHETLKLLVELAGSDVRIGAADDELAPIIAATVVGSAECIDVLLTAGADPNSVDKRGYCALRIAVTSVVDVGKESFYSHYFTNLYRRYARYDVGRVSHENSTRCAMSLVTGGANADRVWQQFAALFPSSDGISFEQMVLCEVLIQCYGFRGLPAHTLSAFVDKLLAIREYGLLKLLYSAGVDPTWNDESQVGISTKDGDREMYRWIKKLRTNARSLKDLCRQRLRRLLSWNVLYQTRRLPVLSEDMKEYVCIMDTDHYSVHVDDSQQQQQTSASADDSVVEPTSQVDDDDGGGGGVTNASKSECVDEDSLDDRPKSATPEGAPPIGQLSVDAPAQDVNDKETLANGGTPSPTDIRKQQTSNNNSATNGQVRNLLEGRTSIGEGLIDDFHRSLLT